MGEREWYQFDDPALEGVTWRVDVTFLRSHWNCIYLRGCPSTLHDPVPAMGCCSYGAYFSTEEDRSRVAEAAARLTPEQWQYRGAGLGRGFGKKKTRVVDGGCIFLNRAGFPGGSGCALHIGALEAGERPMDWKPDVCWQVALRYREEGDGSYVIEEFSRSTWGEGGQDFRWWCTEEPAAYTAPSPLYRTMETELRGVMGDAGYEVLAAYLDRRTPVTIRHPADRATAVEENQAPGRSGHRRSSRSGR